MANILSQFLKTLVALHCTGANTCWPILADSGQWVVDSREFSI